MAELETTEPGTPEETTPDEREARFDETISPLMAQVLELCNQHGISCFATFHLGERFNEETCAEEPFYCTSFVRREDCPEPLIDCYGVVFHGFKVQRPYLISVVTRRDERNP